MKRFEFRPKGLPVIGKATIVWLILSTSTLASLLIAPALYLILSGASDAELARISNIGQAYGVISTLLSVVALCAVAGSVFYQLRQDRISRVDAFRSAQRQIFERLVAEPAIFGPCVMDTSHFRSEAEARRYFFTTLWLGYALQGYETGYYSMSHVRDEFASSMFQSRVARDLWQQRFLAYRENVGEGNLGGFWQIFEEECIKSGKVMNDDAGGVNAASNSVASGPAMPSPVNGGGTESASD